MAQGQIRIIGGRWRGRKLPVPDSADLRPTPNRVRETLFNWLQEKIVGAHCLDAFAGSGAIGFEALSRGAATVTFVDSSRPVVAGLSQIAAQLKAEGCIIYQAELPQQLKRPVHLFDLVFLDPPFQANSLFACCHYLEREGVLAAEAVIYLEAREAVKAEDLPPNWQIVKSKTAGQVAYHLVKRNG